MADRQAEMRLMLRNLRMPAIAALYEDLALKAAKANLTHEAFLYELVRAECLQREEHRVARLQRLSGLPPDKTFRTLQLEQFPPLIREQLERLRSGAFLDDAVNLVAAGKPGVGKSHALAAIGNELVLLGHPVLWTPTATLVQELLAAKRDLRLPHALAKLDRYDCVFLDDIGYVQHDRDEMEVLFTFLSRAVRTPQRGHLDQSGVFRLESDFQRSDDDHGRHRSRRAPLGDPRSDGHGQLPRQGGHAAAHASTSTRARTGLRFRHRRGRMTTAVQPKRDTSRDGSSVSSVPTCALCPGPLPSSRARYCSAACRQRSFRLRRVQLAAIDERQLRAELRRRRCTRGAHRVRVQRVRRTHGRRQTLCTGQRFLPRARSRRPLQFLRRTHLARRAA